MRLYAGKVIDIAKECVRLLISQGDIETQNISEVEKDIEGVLRSYLATEREVTEKAKQLLDMTGRSHSDLGRTKAGIAESHGIKTGDEALDYLLDQVIQIFHHSHHVEEIFVEDLALRKRMAPIFKKHMMVDSSLDAEVKAQLRHLKEGTQAYDIEYGRVMEQIKRKKGLSS